MFDGTVIGCVAVGVAGRNWVGVAGKLVSVSGVSMVADGLASTVAVSSSVVVSVGVHSTGKVGKAGTRVRVAVGGGGRVGKGARVRVGGGKGLMGLRGKLKMRSEYPHTHRLKINIKPDRPYQIIGDGEGRKDIGENFTKRAAKSRRYKLINQPITKWLTR